MNSKKKTTKLFMAFAAGQESKEVNIKRYIGVAPVFVLDVNPSKERLEELYGGITLQNAPEYLGFTEIGPEGAKKRVDQIRLDFIIRTDPEKSDGIELTTKLSLFVANSFRYNGDHTKVQVIDKYGQTAWATEEEVKNKAIPQYANGPANIDADYRPAYIGEEDLTNFIKTYLNIPAPRIYKNGKWEDKPATEKVNSEARLDGIAKYFTGDVSELKKILSFQPKNKVKVMFGVKTTDDNQQYQTVYTNKFLKNNINDYSKLDEDLQERKANGAYSTTEFSATSIKEYAVEATNFNKGLGDVVDDPFASVTSPWAK